MKSIVVKIVFVLCLPLLSLEAFTVSPIALDLAPSGKKSSGMIRLSNPSTQPKAIEIRMFTREPDLEGIEHNQSAEEEFMVYPSQLVIPPKGEKAVRISWIGETHPVKELAYRFVAEELNVDVRRNPSVSENNNQIKVTLKYEGVVYVGSSPECPQIEVDTAVVFQDENKKSFIELVLENSGGRHHFLRDVKLLFKLSGKEQEMCAISEEALQNINGVNLLASHKRRFILPLEGNIPEGPVEVMLDFERDY